MINRVARVIAIAAVVPSISVVMLAETASADYSECPTNYLCLWSGRNGSGEMIFKGNGGVMRHSGLYYPSRSSASSFYNRTLSRFCLFDSSFAKTTVLNAQMLGNLVHDRYWVKIC